VTPSVPTDPVEPAPQPAIRTGSPTASPTATATPTFELTKAVAGDPPSGLPCSTTAGAVACFQQYGDIFWVKDSLADGHSAVADWEDYLDSTSGPVYRRGRCINSLGNGIWARCNKNLGETTVVRYTARVFDAVTKEIFRSGPTLTLDAGT
jgi:hypothetical protein